MLAFLGQLSALIVWPAVTGDMNADIKWTLPVSLVFISVGWWQNYIDADSRLGSFTPLLLDMKKSMLEFVVAI